MAAHVSSTPTLGKVNFPSNAHRLLRQVKKDQFNDIFGDLYIGKNRTTDCHSLLTLRFDFSEISTSSHESMKSNFNRMINSELKSFLERNQASLGDVPPETISVSDGTTSLKNVLKLVEKRGERIFVGVDEYDAPANTVLFREQFDRYQDVADFFNASFFAVMKQATCTVVDKYWVTGVLPVFRDGVSPLNATTIISDKPGYNALCGLTDTEVRDIAQVYLKSTPQKLEDVLVQLKRWYNGYLFYAREKGPSVESLYNPQLVFSHLRGVAHDEVEILPLEEINAVHSSSVLEAIPDTGDASLLRSYLNIVQNKIKPSVAHQFGAVEARQRDKNPPTTWALLYYLGILTHDEDGSHLKCPNMTMTNVITRRFSKFLSKEPQLTSECEAAYSGLFNGQVGPLVELLEHFFGDQPARAVKDCNESALRTVIAAFWSNLPGSCLPELSLLVDPRAPSGNGRSMFLDLFLPSSTFALAPCIELKNIQLEALWRGENGAAQFDSDTTLEALRVKLREETEDQLLRRKFVYGTAQKLVKDVKEEAFKQITRYLDVMMMNEESNSDGAGVNDRRIRPSEDACELSGYAVILLGGTRVLAWHVITRKTKIRWDIVKMGDVFIA